MILLQDVRKGKVVDNDLQCQLILPAPGLHSNNMVDANKTGVMKIRIKTNNAQAINRQSPGITNTEGTRAEATRPRAGVRPRALRDDVLILRSNS